jgi:alkyl hydroperoxide reductase subunit AhpF
VIVLDIYISDDCWSCEESVRIVNDVAPFFPDITIKLLNLQDNVAPEEVFAVPTYVLNGKVIFLGNPTRKQLIEKLTAVQESISIA